MPAVPGGASPVGEQSAHREAGTAAPRPPASAASSRAARCSRRARRSRGRTSPSTRSFSRFCTAMSRTCDRRHAALELHPVRAAVDGGEQAELGAGEQQIRRSRDPGRPTRRRGVRQVAGDVRPRPAAVGALHQVRLVVAALPVVERDEDGVRRRAATRRRRTRTSTSARPESPRSCASSSRRPRSPAAARRRCRRRSVLRAAATRRARRCC